MKLPTIRGTIDRRILVNYHVDPAVLAAILPRPFRPKLIHGRGMAGICLIRLKEVRPPGIPAWLGMSSENAAHRMAVEWDEGDRVRQGVFIHRRDTNSCFNHLVGGRLFPGIHHHAKYTVQETADRLEVALVSDDGKTNLSVRAHLTDRLPACSVFRTLDEASAFFEAGSLGYSLTNNAERFQGLELCCRNWHIEPLEVEEVRSNFFEDTSLFPQGSIAFDCAVLMRGIEHEWHGQPDLCCEVQTAAMPALAVSHGSC